MLYITLTLSCLVPNRKKKKRSHQTSVYNPNGTNVLPGHKGFPKTRADNESHVYATIDETLIYTHLLGEGAEIGVYREFDTNRTATNSKKPLISKEAGADEMEVGVYHPFQAPPLPNRPRSQPLVDNEIYQTENESEEGRSVNLGPRLEPEGGNWGEDWIQLSVFHLTFLNTEIFIPWHLCDYLLFSLERHLYFFSFWA